MILVKETGFCVKLHLISILFCAMLALTLSVFAMFLLLLLSLLMSA